MDYARPELLAEPDWLLPRLADPNVRVIDCGFADAFRRAHIAGAVHLPVHHYIKEPDRAGGDAGVFVMPPPEFETLMGRLGVGPETTVVAYDDDNHRVATRLWWVLTYYGHPNVRVLNGGWHRWLGEGHPVTYRAAAPPPATFRAASNPSLLASAEFLAARVAARDCQVLDARGDEEWEGRESRGNKRVGHVPGARHLEWLHTVSPGDPPVFLPAGDIARLLDGAGIRRGEPVITYCQAGVRAAHAAFVLTLLGWEGVRVYDGSMRDWANREEMPLVRD